ncbi:hypothetical protein BGZ63DRAFT_245557 [Mariannaea sp. PMI_226]|nr:hypothetical protein BGZ63DRAFT_245557 [Mariannaea sp. PMI_226]
MSEIDEFINNKEFQIQFEGTFDEDKQDGGTHVTIPSTELTPKGEKKKSEITLKELRKLRKLSSKHLFCLEGGNPVNNDTKLGYYLTLTPNNVKALEYISAPLTAESEEDSTTASKDDKTANGVNGASNGETKTATVNGKEDGKQEHQKGSAGSVKKRVPVLTLYFTHKSRRPDPEELKARQKWAEDNQVPRGFKDTSGDKGQLGALSDLHGKALLDPSAYAANASSRPASQPSEMTDAQWSSVFRMNRLSHGVYFSGTTVKSARYPAFKIKRVDQPFDPSKEKNDAANKKKSDKSDDDSDSEGSDNRLQDERIPIFSVCDRSFIKVEESASELKTTLLEYGFDNWSAEATISGGFGGFSASANASYEQEKSSTTGTNYGHTRRDLVATYNFPRVELYLDETSLELTNHCRDRLQELQELQAQQHPATRERLADFYHDYGQLFSSRVLLGGRLHSTRTIETTSTTTLDQQKSKMKASAGASFSSSYASGSVKGSYEKQSETTNEKTEGRSNDEMSWEATGGDTTLASNPAMWCSTVKTYMNWRALRYSDTTSLASMISKVDQENFAKIHKTFRGIEYPALVTFGSPKFSSGTPLALASMKRGHIAIYYQDASGLIWESEPTFSSDEWKARSWTKRQMFRARPGSAMAVVNNPYKDDKGADKNYERLIYVGLDNIVKDVIWDTADPKWVPGTLHELGVTVPNGSKIAATSWGERKSASVRVFYQNEDHGICVISYPVDHDSSWYLEPHPLTDEVRPGTWLAAGHRITGHLKRSVPFVYFSTKDQTTTLEKYKIHVLHEDGINANRWYGQEIPNIRLGPSDKLCTVNNNDAASSLGDGQFYAIENTRNPLQKMITIHKLGDKFQSEEVHRRLTKGNPIVSSIATTIHNGRTYVVFVYADATYNNLMLGVIRSASPPDKSRWTTEQAIFPVDEQQGHSLI